MSYLHYHSSRSRERDYDDDPFYSRPLVRTNSKRQRIYDDDEYDDYPYSSSHRSKPSRALTIRQPSQIEKYNVWSYPKSPSKERDHSDHEDDHKIRYKYYTTTTRPSYSYSRSDDEDERDRDVSVKVKTYSSRPKSSHSSHKAFAWPAEAFRRKEKWEREDWETKERDRGDTFWGDEPRLKEREIRYRRIKRTKTDEWKPLKGWRRS